MTDLSQLSNKQFVLRQRPSGLPKESDWQQVKTTVMAPENGKVLVAVTFISVDPAMRSWMNEGKSYMEAIAIGDVMRAAGAGLVLQSDDARFSVGDAVLGAFGVQEFATMNANELTKIDISNVPATAYMGALGTPGFTAYFGLLEIGKAKFGETVLVSGAAGAVGSVVGQIAKIKGCRVVGIAGGAEKCAHLVNNLGFDAAVDYKQSDARAQLSKACPEGVDVYFDNVGGEVLDLALGRIRRGARIVVCGAVSQYNNVARGNGPRNYMSLLMNRATMEGFVIFDYEKRYPEALHALRGWLAAGWIKSYEDVLEGIETFPTALQRMFEGGNTGKMLIKLPATAGLAATAK
ncbi:NADP-dependent oxidoreductase [Variovorax sp. LjRoot130]|uniref:NADP-dependent oxidoreductase n=1 Tax=unclassified Variovorax TaxID=663243 RepID=UPI003ECDA295